MNPMLKWKLVAWNHWLKNIIKSIPANDIVYFTNIEFAQYFEACMQNKYTLGEQKLKYTWTIKLLWTY